MLLLVDDAIFSSLWAVCGTSCIAWRAWELDKLVMNEPASFLVVSSSFLEICELMMMV